MYKFNKLHIYCLISFVNIVSVSTKGSYHRTRNIDYDDGDLWLSSNEFDYPDNSIGKSYNHGSSWFDDTESEKGDSLLQTQGAIDDDDEDVSTNLEQYSQKYRGKKSTVVDNGPISPVVSFEDTMKRKLPQPFIMTDQILDSIVSIPNAKESLGLENHIITEEPGTNNLDSLVINSVVSVLQDVLSEGCAGCGPLNKGLARYLSWLLSGKDANHPNGTPDNPISKDMSEYLQDTAILQKRIKKHKPKQRQGLFQYTAPFLKVPDKESEDIIMKKNIAKLVRFKGDDWVDMLPPDARVKVIMVPHYLKINDVNHLEEFLEDDGNMVVSLIEGRPRPDIYPTHKKKNLVYLMKEKPKLLNSSKPAELDEEDEEDEPVLNENQLDLEGIDLERVHYDRPRLFKREAPNLGSSFNKPEPRTKSRVFKPKIKTRHYHKRNFILTQDNVQNKINPETQLNTPSQVKARTTLPSAATMSRNSNLKKIKVKSYSDSTKHKKRSGLRRATVTPKEELESTFPSKSLNLIQSTTRFPWNRAFRFTTRKKKPTKVHNECDVEAPRLSVRFYGDCPICSSLPSKSEQATKKLHKPCRQFRQLVSDMRQKKRGDLGSSEMLDKRGNQNKTYIFNKDYEDSFSITNNTCGQESVLQLQRPERALDESANLWASNLLNMFGRSNFNKNASTENYFSKKVKKLDSGESYFSKSVPWFIKYPLRGKSEPPRSNWALSSFRVDPTSESQSKIKNSSIIYSSPVAKGTNHWNETLPSFSDLNINYSPQNNDTSCFRISSRLRELFGNRFTKHGSSTRSYGYHPELFRHGSTRYSEATPTKSLHSDSLRTPSNIKDTSIDLQSCTLDSSESSTKRSTDTLFKLSIETSNKDFIDLINESLTTRTKNTLVATPSSMLEENSALLTSSVSEVDSDTISTSISIENLTKASNLISEDNLPTISSSFVEDNFASISSVISELESSTLSSSIPDDSATVSSSISEANSIAISSFTPEVNSATISTSISYKNSSTTSSSILEANSATSLISEANSVTSLISEANSVTSLISEANSVTSLISEANSATSLIPEENPVISPKSILEKYTSPTTAHTDNKIESDLGLEEIQQVETTLSIGEESVTQAATTNIPTNEAAETIIPDEYLHGTEKENLILNKFYSRSSMFFERKKTMKANQKNQTLPENISQRSKKLHDVKYVSNIPLTTQISTWKNPIFSIEPSTINSDRIVNQTKFTNCSLNLLLQQIIHSIIQSAKMTNNSQKLSVGQMESEDSKESSDTEKSTKAVLDKIMKVVSDHLKREQTHNWVQRPLLQTPDLGGKLPLQNKSLNQNPNPSDLTLHINSKNSHLNQYEDTNYTNSQYTTPFKKEMYKLKHPLDMRDFSREQRFPTNSLSNSSAERNEIQVSNAPVNVNKRSLTVFNNNKLLMNPSKVVKNLNDLNDLQVLLNWGSTPENVKNFLKTIKAPKCK